MSGCTFELRDATLSHPGTVALAGARLRIGAGERVALVGPSGAGKTSLLRLLGAAARATSGSVLVDDRDLASLDPAELRGVRARLGFVHQDHALVPNLRAISNALLGRVGSQGLIASLKSVWWPSRAEEEAVHALFVRVGIGDRLYQRVDSLSGGERQRVAIARALVTRPACVLADEPTGNLDRATADGVFEQMLQLARDQGTAFVVVTHDTSLADRCSRQLRLVAGQLA